MRITISVALLVFFLAVFAVGCGSSTTGSVEATFKDRPLGNRPNTGKSLPQMPAD
jgi:hypothetical protein